MILHKRVEYSSFLFLNWVSSVKKLGIVHLNMVPAWLSQSLPLYHLSMHRTCHLQKVSTVEDKAEILFTCYRSCLVYDNNPEIKIKACSA